MSPQQIIKDLIKVKLTKNQQAALESFIDSMGLEVFKNSNLLKVINRSEFGSVPKELSKWNIKNGRMLDELKELRAKEIVLFTS